MGKEYIELEALNKAIEDELYWNESTKASARAIARTVHAADVAPVVHGKWDIKKHPPGLPEWAIRIMCSNCGLQTSQVSKHCPNCGAKMDAEG